MVPPGWLSRVNEARLLASCGELHPTIGGLWKIFIPVIETVKNSETIKRN